MKWQYFTFMDENDDRGNVNHLLSSPPWNVGSPPPSQANFGSNYTFALAKNPQFAPQR